MKKAYIIPMIIVDQTENDEMLMASQGSSTWLAGGGDEGTSDQEGSSIFGTGDDNDFVQGAKGSFAFCDDFEYSIDM